MAHKMDELERLKCVLTQNYSMLQSVVKNFVDNNNKLLNVYLDSVDDEKASYEKYKIYIMGLFDMLLKTTDFISEMIMKAQNTRETYYVPPTLGSNDSVCSDASGTSRQTITGYQNGYTYVNDEVVPYENCNGSHSFDVRPKKIRRPYRLVNISRFRRGDIIPKAHVTSVQLDTLSFHICLPNTREIEVLTALYNAKDRMPYKCPPTAGIIFGMKVDDGIVRSVRCLPVSCGKVFLLDFGDIIDVSKNLDDIFYLTKEEQNLPAQAILCKLHHPENAGVDEIESQRNYLNALLYQHASFRVVENMNGVFRLEIYQLFTETNAIDEHLCYSNASSPLSSISREDKTSSPNQINQLTVEELEMLNEEPPSTSNALMAVIGHIPKDDTRICRFYDPKTDSCFKGNNCRQQHVLMLKEHFTKDIVPANVYAEIPTLGPVRYEANQVIKITVTHVTNFEYFYGIDLNISHSVEPLIWTDEDILEADYLIRPPIIYDIVLAKFDDGKWYRAQVVDSDEFGNKINVFYMDYGNCQSVPLKRVARCSEKIAKLPPQAQQFRLADVRIIPSSKENHRKGMAMLCERILNRDLNVEVVSHYEDLVVRFIDTPFSEIPQLLAEMHYVELIEMLPV